MNYFIVLNFIKKLFKKLFYITNKIIYFFKNCFKVTLVIFIFYIIFRLFLGGVNFG